MKKSTGMNVPGFPCRPETLYFRETGDSSQKGTIKYYDLAENCIPPEILDRPDPCPDDMDHLEWRVMPDWRCGAWNKPPMPG